MSYFMGVPYPIKKTAFGFLPKQTGIDQIKSDLLVLLLTNPGERVMTPEFGTPLRRLIFEQNDQFLQETARNMIIDSINRWEPRIVVKAIDISSNPSRDVLNRFDDGTNSENILYIRINFIDPENIIEVQSLVLEMPLSQAGG